MVKPMKKIIFLVSFLIIVPIQSFSIIYPIPPKYVSLKKNEVNLRYNANIEAPIKFIYQNDITVFFK